MSRTINLKYAGKCADCGASLPVGTRAKYYGRGRVYGLDCHPKPAGLKSRAPKDYGEGGEFGKGRGVCEDAPCCGCCGPQGDGDYYGTSAEEYASEPYDDSPY